MSDHEAVRNFLRDTALSIRDDISFYYARESDFNPAISIKGKTGPKVLLLPLKHNDEGAEDSLSLNRNYQVTMLFYDNDSMQGAQEETAAILDKTDILLRGFQAKLNLKSMDSEEEADVLLGTDTVTVSNQSVTERIKFTADNVTGWEYEFTLTVPDQFDYCALYD